MMKKQVLDLLRQNARFANSEMALRLGISEAEVAAAIAELEETQVIQGYTVIVNEDVMTERKVRAEIEVKVTPRRDGGFDTVARRIARFPEVVRMNLVSGSYDLLLEVEGDSLQEVARFVSDKLSTIDGVLSTATLFQLKTYKEAGRILADEEEHERLQVCP